MMSTEPAVAKARPFATTHPPAEATLCSIAGGHAARSDLRDATLLDFEAASEPGLARGAGHWMEQMLDQVDYPMLLVDEDGCLIHANATARAAIDALHPITLTDGVVRARASQDAAPLRRALDVAVRPGLRSLVTLRGEATPVCAAVVPLRAAGTAGRGMALLILGRKSMGEDLSSQWFGRCHGLTPAESRVLHLLCEGLLPGEIAIRQGVAESTIRTQICSIRAKTGTQNIRALLRRVAMLPPLVTILREFDRR